ncbi:MAG: hypothetical protein ABR583_02195 [Gaiellaceae bacterium]
MIIVAAFALPGFILSGAARYGRPYAATASDLEFVLRSLGLSLVVHVLFFVWTRSSYATFRDSRQAKTTTA